MKTVIAARELVKTFRVSKRRPGLAGAIRHLFVPDTDRLHAVDRVSFDIEAGETVGYIGKNGAGKSTTIKMLTGILVPTSGSVEVGGLVPSRRRQEVARRIGVVFGQRTHLKWDIPVQESFRLLEAVYEIPSERFERNLRTFRELLDLDELLDRPVRKLSLGQRMRCDLAAAFLHDPEVVFLDEPTIGLDVLVKERVREFVRRINEERGTTVILTTHDLRDIERLCRRAIIIDRGRIVFDGALADIRRRFGSSKTVTFELRRPPDSESMGRLALPPGAGIVEQTPRSISIRCDTEQVSTSDAVRRMLELFDVTDISIEETSIEDIVKRLYQGEITG